MTRCDKCRGKGKEECRFSNCNGTGQIRCTYCDGRGRTETATEIIKCACGDGKVTCSECKGDGKVNCPLCDGLGGFYHKATLRADWHTLITTWYDQNSSLPEKKIEKGQRLHFWSKSKEPWSYESSIDQFFGSLKQDEVEEKIPLKDNLIRRYMTLHTLPRSDGNNRMRRLACSVEQMKFEEVHYTLDQKYINKKTPQLGKLSHRYFQSEYFVLENTFRFWKYPTSGNKQKIYENDYPLNCCGCCGMTFFIIIPSNKDRRSKNSSEEMKIFQALPIILLIDERNFLLNFISNELHKFDN